MASDIVPIQLSLTAGDLVTLWAPRWREEGEEWEAFLGDDDNLFAFPDVAQLAAFVRTADDHDLVDHPAWPVVPDLSVGELTPDDTQCYDIIGVPELVAEDLDTWLLGELSEVVEMLRSLADVCELSEIDDVLDAAPAFSMIGQGTVPFAGREGRRLWDELVETVAQRWDEVVDALDEMVSTPEADATALAAAEKELADERAEDTAVDLTKDGEDAVVGVRGGPVDEADAAAARFWEGVGIDPIRISTPDGDWVTLRCYLDDKPVFLGSDGRIDVFPTERALAGWLGRSSTASATESTTKSTTDTANTTDTASGSDTARTDVDSGSDALTKADPSSSGPAGVTPATATEPAPADSTVAGPTTAGPTTASSTTAGPITSATDDPPTVDPDPTAAPETDAPAGRDSVPAAGSVAAAADQTDGTGAPQGGADGHDLIAASTWPQVVEAAAADELTVRVDDMNAYVLTGLDADILDGTTAVDPVQLELAVELLRDVGVWADDDEPRRVLAETETLGWLVSFIVKPDPTRLAPSPPFTGEATAFRELVTELTARLRQH